MPQVQVMHPCLCRVQKRNELTAIARINNDLCYGVSPQRRRAVPVLESKRRLSSSHRLPPLPGISARAQESKLEEAPRQPVATQLRYATTPRLPLSNAHAELSLVTSEDGLPLFKQPSRMSISPCSWVITTRAHSAALHSITFIVHTRLLAPPATRSNHKHEPKLKSEHSRTFTFLTCSCCKFSDPLFEGPMF
ncbi:hypothetical protein QAD02_003047 [Eretmocerus hayati]|uniref:Uncharacterized protein n=1 Tax=Eretmocerus hayati TaxID=131215 RepID=A0ACC2NLM1_9HYME|nr:hypothetical protein QAD02_003047 [Eretmocerus hayati]